MQAQSLTALLLVSSSLGLSMALNIFHWCLVGPWISAGVVADCFYIGLFDCSQADSLHSHVILQKRRSFYSMFLNIHRSGAFTALTWSVPCETTAFSVRSVYTIQPCHFMQSHIRKVYACLALTCHLHFWHNDRDILCATVAMHR